MSDESHGIPSSLREQREKLVEALTAHFANDRLDAEEFEARLDRAYRARSVAELAEVSADLPAIEIASSTARRRSVAPPEEVSAQQAVVAIMGGTVRKGAWIPARKVNALALMGGIELDLRDARLGRGVTQLDLAAIMGGIEVIVPPDLRVECEGFGLLGGFEGLAQGGRIDDPHQPTLRIRGVAVMGGIEVVQRLPGETARQQRQRQRKELRDKRRLRRGE